MTQQRLHEIIHDLGSEVTGRGPVLEFTFQGTRLACVSDREHDRMRIIAPIRRQSELSADQIVRILEANFHTALDARYATSEGVLYAAYIHPLAPLTEAQVRSAFVQVSNLVRTFGTTYSSGVLQYGTSGSP